MLLHTVKVGLARADDRQGRLIVIVEDQGHFHSKPNGVEDLHVDKLVNAVVDSIQLGLGG